MIVAKQTGKRKERVYHEKKKLKAAENAITSALVGIVTTRLSIAEIVCFGELFFSFLQLKLC